MKELTVEITDRCSLNCLHCSTKASNNGQFFISAKTIKQILPQFPDFVKVRLSGGEPFEHPQILELADLIRKDIRTLEILSSGVYHGHSIPRELLHEIKPYISGLEFPVYGGQQTHDRICRYPNAFFSLCHTIDNAALEDIPFSFHTVAMRENLESCGEISNFVKEAGRIAGCNAGLYVYRLIRQGRAAEHPEIFLDDKERELFRKTMEEKCLDDEVDVKFKCSFLEMGCTQGKGKAAYTIGGKLIGCSALKYNSQEGEFACRGNW